MGATARSGEARARADDVLRVSLARADSVVTATDRRGTAAARELVTDLRAADRELRRRLGRYADSDERFTAASLASYQRQVELVTARAEAALARHLATTTRAAATASIEETAALLGRLDEAFTGIARPLRLRQASAMSRALRRGEASMLRSRATSVDRYGVSMIGEFERRMRVGLIAGLSQREMVDDLVRHGGPSGRVSMAAREEPAGVRRTREEDIPEGLFVRYRSWAWRIVRTETARAYSVARMEGLFEQRTELPTLRKKILATFDARTAMDSVLVHGQVRALEDSFVDGAGRVYLQPPARPNDREVVIPWLPEWEETAITRPASPEMVDRARRGEGLEVDRAHRLATARARAADDRRRPALAVPAALPIALRAPAPSRAAPATPAPPPVARPPVAREDFSATPLPGLLRRASAFASDARGAREALREMVRRELPGVRWRGGPGSHLVHVVADRANQPSHHGADASLLVPRSLAKLAERTMTRLARGAEVFVAREGDAVRTFIHEEVHGSSWKTAGLRMRDEATRVIEEATTEMTARRVARSIPGIYFGGAYAPEIRVLTETVARELSVAPEVAVERIMAASGALRTSHEPLSETEADYRTRFARQLGVSGEALSSMSARRR